MPAAARVRPWCVRTIAVGPRRATTRAVSPGSASSRVPGRTRPSALLTTLLVTTTTSPSCSSTTARSRAARSSPAAHLGDACGRDHPEVVAVGVGTVLIG